MKTSVIFTAAFCNAAMAASSGKGLEILDGFNIDMAYNTTTDMIDYTFVVPD